MATPLLDLMKDNSGYDRTFRRYRVNFRLRVQAVAGEGPAHMPDGSGATLLGFAHNVSLSGMGFVCSGQLGLGSLIGIEVALEEQTYILLARVRWQQPMNTPGKTMHHYGAQFLRTEAVLRFIPAAAEFLLAQGRVGTAGRGSTPSVTSGTAPTG